eukprot:UN02664
MIFYADEIRNYDMESAQRKIKYKQQNNIYVDVLMIFNCLEINNDNNDIKIGQI